MAKTSAEEAAATVDTEAAEEMEASAAAETSVAPAEMEAAAEVEEAASVEATPAAETLPPPSEAANRRALMCTMDVNGPLGGGHSADWSSSEPSTIVCTAAAVLFEGTSRDPAACVGAGLLGAATCLMA